MFNLFYNKLENVIHNIFNQKHMKIIDLENNELDKKYKLFYFNDKENLLNIKNELDNCQVGLNNLKETYNNDYNIKLNIDILIDRNNDLSNHINFNLEKLIAFYSSK